MTPLEAYAFIALAFVLGGFVGSGLTYQWAIKEIFALRSDVDDLMQDLIEEATTKENTP